MLLTEMYSCSRLYGMFLKFDGRQLGFGSVSSIHTILYSLPRKNFKKPLVRPTKADLLCTYKYVSAS